MASSFEKERTSMFVNSEPHAKTYRSHGTDAEIFMAFAWQMCVMLYENADLNSLHLEILFLYNSFY